MATRRLSIKSKSYLGDGSYIRNHNNYIQTILLVSPFWSRVKGKPCVLIFQGFLDLRRSSALNVQDIPVGLLFLCLCILPVEGFLCRRLPRDRPRHILHIPVSCCQAHL